ncbi:MAG: RNA polymerase sigma factor [Planctomycetota bacterium]
MGTDDANLALLAKAGDRAAFALLVDRYLPRVRGFLYRLAGARGGTDDLAQEVFLIAIRSLSNLREPQYFSTWLFGIAFRVYKSNTRRDAGMRREDFDERDLVSYQFSENAIITEEEHAIVAAAIARLPERHRDAFLLRHAEDLSTGEVAKILEVPEGTARRWDFEARERLRELLANKLSVTDTHRLKPQ